jgi:hypothetical protein
MDSITSFLSVTNTLIAGSVGVLSLLLFVAWKTESFHLIRLKMLQLVVGHTNEGSSDVDRLIKEYTDFYKFRLITGLRPKTKEVMHELIRWSKKYDANLLEYGFCESYFDYDEKQISLAKVNACNPMPFVVSAILVLGVFIGLLVYSINDDRVWAAFNTSGDDFLMDVNSAQRLQWVWTGETVNRKRCDAKVRYDGAIIFSAKDRKLLCEALKTKEYKEHYQHLLEEQKWVILQLIFALMILGAFVYRHGLKYERARTLAIDVPPRHDTKTKSDD